jgi:hypothetical protein
VDSVLAHLQVGGYQTDPAETDMHSIQIDLSVHAFSHGSMWIQQLPHQHSVMMHVYRCTSGIRAIRRWIQPRISLVTAPHGRMHSTDAANAAVAPCATTAAAIPAARQSHIRQSLGLQFHSIDFSNAQCRSILTHLTYH